MGAPKIIVDTGPLIAFLNRADQHHKWAAKEFKTIFEPLITCEAVISETIFLLQSDGMATDYLFEVIDRGMLLVEFSATEHFPDLRRLIKKYSDVPMSMADACLVRMSELTPNSQVFTTDRDFKLYRRYGRQIISLRAPF